MPDEPLEDDGELDVEEVDGLPVLADVRPLEPARPQTGAALAQTAAPATKPVAATATGFVAGAATAAVLGRHLLGRRLARPRLGPRAELLEVVATRSYLVNVHVLGRRGQ
jgi:hypothetical protein